MLQFLLADYLTGYGLPSLCKTVTESGIKVIWTLTSHPNTYVLTSSPGGEIVAYVADTCHCDTVAIRVVVSLLEDGSERIAGVRGLSANGNPINYLTE